MRYFVWIVLAFMLVGCASGKCRQKKDNKDFIEHVSNLPEFKKNRTKELTQEDLKTVQVYVADGSKQCQSETQIPVEKFKSQLEKAGIKVLKVEHKSDGMMRPQVCGAPTGMIYVFHIQKLKLAQAKALGFQLLQSSPI